MVEEHRNHHGKYFFTLIFASVLFFSIGMVSHNAFADTGVTVQSVDQAVQQILFQDDYSSNAGWTQVGTQVTVNSMAHPGVVYFDNAMEGSGVTQSRVFKQIPSVLPGSWTADFGYKFTASTIPSAYPLALTSSNADPERQGSTGSAILVYHGDNSNVLHLRVWLGSTVIDSPTLYTGISINQNTQYYVRLDKTPTQLTLSVFLDPLRTIQVPGSPVTLTISPTDLANLNYVQHSTSLSSGSARTLTAQIDHIIIYTQTVGSLSHPTTSQLQVNSQDSFGNTLTGFYTELYASNGIQLDANYTPYNFTLNNGQNYTVHVENFGKFMFSHWLDTGSTDSNRTISITSNESITAVYKTVPQPPTGLNATAFSSSQINLNWNAPTNDGGSPVTSYELKGSTDGSTWSVLVRNTHSTSTTYSDTGLSANTTYYYRVFAINDVGTSLSSNTTSATTPISTIQVGNTPLGIGVNSVTNKIYVANEADNTVSVIDSNTNNVIKTISVGSNPDTVDVNTVTNKIYVANTLSDTVSVIDGSTDTLIKTIPVSSHPLGLVVNPNTNRIYTASYPNSTVTVIDGSVDSVIDTVAEKGGTMYLGINTATNKIYVSKIVSGTVTVINGSNDRILTDIKVGKYPQIVLANKNTNMIYVINHISNTVSVINGSTNMVVNTIPLTSNRGGGGINDVTNKVYVTNGPSGSVEVIDGTTNSIIKKITLGNANPDYVGIDTVTNKIYVADEGSNKIFVINGL